MHQPNQPQVYPYCIQANIKSSGNIVPTETVTFPAAYNLNDDFRTFNLYYGDDFNAFTPPGPAVWNGSGSQVPQTPATPASSSAVEASAALSSDVSAPATPSTPAYDAPASSDAAYAPTSTELVTSGLQATGRCRRR
jgi:hypothetical protein